MSSLVTSAQIHPSAVIDPSAILEDNVTVGPSVVIGPQCRIGAGTVLQPHSVILGYTHLGQHCLVSTGAVLGGPPQDRSFRDEPSWVKVGDRVQIRECVTIHRATGEGKATTVGDEAMLMAYAHIAHNCTLGKGAIIANAVQMAGHVNIGDHAFISATCVLHQFVRVGRLAMMSGLSGARMDLPPFSMMDGRPAVVRGINAVGLRRQGFSAESRQQLKRAFQLLWFSGLNQKQAIEAIQHELPPHPALDELIEFVQSSKRGIYSPIRKTASERPASHESDDETAHFQED